MQLVHAIVEIQHAHAHVGGPAHLRADLRAARPHEVREAVARGQAVRAPLARDRVAEAHAEGLHARTAAAGAATVVRCAVRRGCVCVRVRSDRGTSV